ncbi:hypothetical protein ATANTOWER_030227 [Ataeniobius toweri]|uniref:SLC26A/SulP transporter domain-containing protein n=1 Tax=Ataeniobius toweri TaxID=208326 RepID=A0ABU7A8Y2_9TELE|nr:hypothetical protein [Ataeniobius toweri]
MVGSVTERLAPDEIFLTTNGTNLTSEVDIAARDSYRVQVAATTTVLGGLIQVLLGVIKFGFVGTYLSEPLVRGYTSAAAAHALVAQLKHLFGVSPRRYSGPLSQVYVPKRNWTEGHSALMSLCRQTDITLQTGSKSVIRSRDHMH